MSELEKQLMQATKESALLKVLNCISLCFAVYIFSMPSAVHTCNVLKKCKNWETVTD